MDRGIKRKVLEKLLGNDPYWSKQDEFIRRSMQDNFSKYGRAALEVYNLDRLKQELKLRDQKVSGSHKDLVDRVEAVYRMLAGGRRSSESPAGVSNKRQRTTLDRTGDDDSWPQATASSASSAPQSSPTGDYNYTFKFALPKHKVHRVLRIPGDTTMEAAFLAMLSSVGFDGGHLYSIRLRDGRTVVASLGGRDPFGDRNSINGKRLKVKDAGLWAGDMLPVEYDEWPLSLLVQAVTPGRPDDDGIVLVESKGKAPSEYGNDEDDEDDY
eukprot:TRINITY_DN1568_c1_g2_i1.p1 TRINITY_DN1568_c1_g2~~TRINITY_DN1568_c1_g2_i1.p1  ORF type:complete len:269 (-),score=70.50 TRINITY_DN1568_c1_g2_i1:437-1243(-)